MSAKPQKRQTEYERTARTKQVLLDAAIELFAERGVENTPVRDIIERAGQKNASALQYHFGSKAGLIEALHIRYYSEELECRAKLAAEIFTPGEQPTVRDIATLMARATFTLMGSNPGYAQWAGQFAHVVAERGMALYRETGSDFTADVAMIHTNLFSALPHIPHEVLFYRLDQVVRFIAIQSAVLAKGNAQHSGLLGELSEAMLIDAITALFEADISDETANAIDKLKAAWQAPDVSDQA